jgi:hypothetical protein
MDHISLICHSTVGRLFALFCNPLNRGPHFQWSNFPDMAGQHCKTQIAISDFRARDIEELYAHAEQTGQTIAKMMVEAAGFE